MPIALVSAFPYFLGIVLSFIFAEFKTNFPDTIYLLGCLLLYFLLTYKLIKPPFIAQEYIYFSLFICFVINSSYWLIQFLVDGDLNYFVYPLITVAFNILAPYFLARFCVDKKNSSFFLYFVVTIVLCVAIWQYVAVNILYGVEYIYFNDRISSPLFQGQVRLPSVFVSANNLGVFIISIITLIYSVRYRKFPQYLLFLALLICLYFTYVRKIYFLLFLITIFYFSLQFRFKFEKIFRMASFFSLVLIPFYFVIGVTDGKYEDGVMSTQTMGSRLAQWQYFLDRFWSGDIQNLIFGDYTLQSSFERLGYYIIYLDNNLIMSLTFGGVVFCILQIVLLISLLSYFNENLHKARSWSTFGLLSLFSIFWVGMFSNIIDNHEVNMVLYTSVWLSFFKVKKVLINESSNY
jgi:hypothetical protein